MKAKEYLQQLKRLDTLINQKIKELDELRSMSTVGSVDYSTERVQSSHSQDDILINETEAIANCSASVGILSDETIIGMHPWVDDPQAELDRLKKQKEEEQAEFERQQEQAYNPFGQKEQPQDKGGEVNEE